MVPTDPDNHATNSRSRNTVSFRKLRVASTLSAHYLSDLENLHIGQFRARMFHSFDRNSFASCCPPFFLTVRNVLGLSSEKQMRGIHARWIIASMQDTEPFGNFSVMDGPRNPVSSPKFSKDLKSSISTCVTMCGPNPTRSTLIDLGPKSRYCSLIHRVTSGESGRGRAQASRGPIDSSMWAAAEVEAASLPEAA